MSRRFPVLFIVDSFRSAMRYPQVRRLVAVYRGPFSTGTAAIAPFRFRTLE
jgi:hypothetical protein